MAEYARRGAKETVMMGFRVIALEVLLSFLAGAASAALGLPWDIALIGICLAIVWLCRARAYVFSTLFLIVGTFLFGFFYYFFYSNAREAYMVLPQGDPASFTGIVSDEPRATERSLRFPLSLDAPHRGMFTVIVPPNQDIRYGDALLLRGNVTVEEGEYVTLFPKIDVRAHHKGHWLKEWLIGLKAELVRGFERTLPPDNAALLGGITLGARSSFSSELKNAMVDSGTIHIVAVSGYNISILAITIGNIAMFFLARRFAIWASIALVVLFTGMVGTEASVVRAALMGIMGLLGEMTGRPKDQAYAITGTAALMVAWDPTTIRNDIGFMLSFLSLLGVVYLAPALRSLWRKSADRGIFEWKENMDTTIGAQLAVLPVILTVFGKASLSSIAANILIIPAVPFTMGAGFFLGVANAVSPFIGFPIAKIAELLTGYEITVMHIFSRYAIPIGNFFLSPMAVVLYYGLLIAFIAHRTKRARLSTLQ